MTQRHSAIEAGRTAVITGAASGIGLAAAKRLAAYGMRICLADLSGDRLEAAAIAVRDAGAGDVLAQPADIARPDDIKRLHDAVLARFGEVAIFMNNAGVGAGGQGKVLGEAAAWERVLNTNFRGPLLAVQAFVPAMAKSGRSCAIVHTGSKQGITTPPGDASYNVSKAALKVMTEALAHEVRNIPGAQISVHLLVPGFTYTGINAQRHPQKPPSAWTAEQVAERLLEGMARGDFYIICPDNETTAEMDKKRILWSAGDLVENRPALSRWHPDYASAFAAYMKEPL